MARWRMPSTVIDGSMACPRQAAVNGISCLLCVAVMAFFAQDALDARAGAATQKLTVELLALPANTEASRRSGSLAKALETLLAASHVQTRLLDSPHFSNRRHHNNDQADYHRKKHRTDHYNSTDHHHSEHHVPQHQRRDHWHHAPYNHSVSRGGGGTVPPEGWPEGVPRPPWGYPRGRPPAGGWPSMPPGGWPSVPPKDWPVVQHRGRLVRGATVPPEGWPAGVPKPPWGYPRGHPPAGGWPRMPPGGWPSVPPADWPGKRRLHHTPRGEKMQTTVPAGKKGGEVIQVHTASGWVVEVVIPVGLSAGQSFQFHLPLGNQTDPTHSGANSSDSNSTHEDECDQEDEEDECDENAEEEDHEPATGQGKAAQKVGAKDIDAGERTEAEGEVRRIKALEDRVNSLEKENEKKEHQDRVKEHHHVDHPVVQDKAEHPQDGEEEAQKDGDGDSRGRRHSDEPAQGVPEVPNQSREEGDKTFQAICGADQVPMTHKTRERIRLDFHLFDGNHDDLLDLSELEAAMQGLGFDDETDLQRFVNKYAASTHKNELNEQEFEELMVHELAHVLLSDDEIIRVRSAFQIADDNSDHLLDASEFQKAVTLLGLKDMLDDKLMMKLQLVFDTVARRACGGCDATVDYTQFVKLVTPAVLGCGKDDDDDNNERAIDTRKDLRWVPSPSGAAARGAARAAISGKQHRSGVQVVNVPVNSKDTIEKVVRLEAKQAELQRMLTTEQAIAAAATAAAAKAASAAENESSRNHLHDYLSRFDDSRAFNRDVADVVPGLLRHPRVACKERGVSMRIAASQAAHSLRSIAEEMRQDQDEDKREEVHATTISEDPGALQKLMQASREVTQKEWEGLRKVQENLAAFDPPDCVAPPPPPSAKVKWNYRAMRDIIAHAVQQDDLRAAVSARLFGQAMGGWHGSTHGSSVWHHVHPPQRDIPDMVKSKIQDKAASAAAWRKTLAPPETDAVQQAVPGFVHHTHAGGGVLHEYAYLPLGVGQRPLRPLRPVTPPSRPPWRASEPWHAERDKGGEEQERRQRGRQPQGLARHTGSAPHTHAASGLRARSNLRQRRGAPQSRDNSYKVGKSLTKQALDDQQYSEEAAAIKALMPKGPVVAGAGLRGIAGLLQRQAALTRVAAKIKRLERDADQAPNPSLSSASSAHA